MGQPEVVDVSCLTTLYSAEDSLDCTRETLVTLRVVVLEADLELDGLDEVTLLLAVGVFEELTNRAPHACH